VSRSSGLHVTALELPARWNARDEALAEVHALLGAGPPSDLVVLPELALTGYVSPTLDADVSAFAEPLDGPTVSALSALARRHRTHLVGPLVLREGDGTFNTSLLFGRDGALRAVYKKRHPWVPERWASAGLSPHPVVDVEGARVTLAICYDLHFLPAEAARELTLADVLVFTSAWVDDEATRVPLLVALARAHDVAIVNANWGPGVVRIPGQGDSVVIGSKGEIVARAEAGARVVRARVPLPKDSPDRP